MPDIIDARSLRDFETPRLIRLGPNLYGAFFMLMKLTPARVILDEAEADGRLGPGGMICETTSGTFGLALAMLARLRGYRLTLVSDPAIDAPLRRRLEELGARVDIIEKPGPGGGYQNVRMDRLNKLLADHPDAFWPAQYSNPANPAAYGEVAARLRDRLGRPDILVGTVGSGGSMSGLARALRSDNADLRVIGVDTPNSVIFGQPDGPRLLRGLGNSLMPANVDHSQFDEVHWVDAASGFEATRRLYRDHAIFAGPTSGAAHLVAARAAARDADALTIVVLPDEGHRYIDTVYNDSWLRAVPGWTKRQPPEPRLLGHPSDICEGWSWFGWKRRPLASVLAREAA